MVKKITLFILLNLVLLLLLYLIPIESNFLKQICIFKSITGRECWNCGMTRAFLSILHFDFKQAYLYNNKIIVVFPLTIGVYLNSWYKYIIKKGDVEK